jgi:hypothetical protein
MTGFRVWVRPMDYEYRVSVDGATNADWLLNELSRSFVFKSAVPLDRHAADGVCTFQVPFTSLLPFSLFRRLLSAIPEVTLIMQPALA